jgi:hypothetical protein
MFSVSRGFENVSNLLLRNILDYTDSWARASSDVSSNYSRYHPLSGEACARSSSAICVCNPKCCLRNDYFSAQNLPQSGTELCYIELDGSVQIRD